MSSKTHEHTIRIRAVDDSTATLMGIARTMRAVGFEIRLLRVFLRILQYEEIITAQTTRMLTLSLLGVAGIIGLVAGVFAITAATQITAQRAIIPVGQTLPGQLRQITAGGMFMGHAGEVIGRLSQPMPGAGGGGDQNLYFGPVTFDSGGKSVDEFSEDLRFALRGLTRITPTT